MPQTYGQKIEEAVGYVGDAENAAEAGDKAKAETLAQRAASAIDTADAQAKSLASRLARLKAKSDVESALVRPTRFAGIVAEVTRFEDTGGMFTLEVTLRNTGDGAGSYSAFSPDAYLLDEQSARRWNDVQRSGFIGSGKLERGEELRMWFKFKVEPPVPDYFTAVVNESVTFEQIAPAS
jgi:hypothetical protein